jgi:hypothetical protein
MDARDDLLETRLQNAYESGDKDVVACLRKEKKDSARNDRTLCTEKTIDRLKKARRLVRQRILVELQDLVILQTGLLCAAHDRLSIPYNLLQESLESEDVIKRVSEHLRNAEAACDADLANVASMHDLGWGCLERTKRFAAKDLEGVHSRERERIRRERKNGPRTWNMMMKVVDDSKTMSQIPDVVSSHMTKLNESLQLVLDVAEKQYRELGGWDKALLDENTQVDPELALVGKLMVDAKEREMWRVGSKTKGDLEEKKEEEERPGGEGEVL